MNTLIIYLKEKEVLLSELVLQLQKDLSLSGINSDIIKEIHDINDLANKLVVLIEDLLMYRSDLFQNLLYRVDINEKKLSNNIGDHLQQKLADLIIKREILKVYFRKKYSPK